MLTLKRTTPDQIKDFRRRAGEEGITVNQDGALWTTYLPDDKIKAVFGATVTYRLLPPSAGNSDRSGPLCTADLKGIRIPPRYAADLSAIAIGHQICE